MNAIPMLGSLGSIVLVATMGPAGRNGRPQLRRRRHVPLRHPRLHRRPAGPAAEAARPAGHRLAHGVPPLPRQRPHRSRARPPTSSAAPSTGTTPSRPRCRRWPRSGSRVWEHTSSDTTSCTSGTASAPSRCRWSWCRRESAPIDEVDPAAASALHRLLVVHRLQPELPASIDLRAFDRVELCGAEDPARSLARAMICSATAFHSPDHLVVAVLCSEQNLVHWDWLKWLPHAQSAQQSDAVGPMRMVSTSLAEIATLLPPDLSDRPRFGADERPPSPHILFVTDGAKLPPGNHVIPPDGLHGVTVLDLPARWDELEDASRLRLQFAAEPPQDGKHPILALRLREEPVKALADQCDLATAEAFARRLAPLHTVTGRGRRRRAARSPDPPTSWTCWGSATSTASTRTPPGAPRPARDRLRVPIGLGEGGAPDPPRHQGVRPAGHGPARPGHRRHRLRQVGVPAHARARPGHDPLARAAQHGAGRLQGRRDVRRHVGACRTSPR